LPVEARKEFKKILEYAEVDAVDMINTIPFNNLYPKRKSPLSFGGGISGEVIKDHAFDQIGWFAENSILPIIGGGGVNNIHDVGDFLECGAAAVSIGSAHIMRPWISTKMVNTGERYLRKKCFQRITVPRIVPASGACENIDTLFEIGVDRDINWFNKGEKRVYFAQTGQLYLESLLGRGGLEKVYCIGPSGRAEPKVDTRHLTEFEMIEIEFRGNFGDLLVEMEDFITNFINTIKAIPKEKRVECGLPNNLSHLENHPDSFPRVQYEDAVKELGLEWGDDISSTQEKELIKNHGRGPILIVRFPNPESERMQKTFLQLKRIILQLSFSTCCLTQLIQN